MKQEANTRRTATAGKVVFSIVILLLLGSCQVFFGFGNVRFQNDTDGDITMAEIRFGDAEYEFDDNSFSAGSIVPGGTEYLQTSALGSDSVEVRITFDGDWEKLPGSGSHEVDRDEFYTIRIRETDDDEYSTELIEDS